MSDDPVQNPYTSPSPVSADPSAQGTQGSLTQGSLTIRQSAKTNQVISLALVMGTIVITGILLLTVVPNATSIADLFVINQDSLILLGIGYGVSAIGAVAGVIMRKVIKQSAVTQFRSHDPQDSLPVDVDETFPGGQVLLGGYATANIVGGALLEGPAVANAVLMLMEENLWHLVPIALAIFGLLLSLPTVTKVKYFVENAVGRSK